MKLYDTNPSGDNSTGATLLGSCLHDPLATISKQFKKIISDVFAHLRGFINALPAASVAILLFSVAVLVWLVDDRSQFRLLTTHRQIISPRVARYRTETVGFGQTEFEAMDLARMSPPSKKLSQGDAVHMSDAVKCSNASGSTDCTCAGQPNTCEKEHAERIYKRNKWRQQRWLAGKDPEALQSRMLEFFASPLYPCSRERRLGSWTLGGQWVCDVASFNRSAIIYVIGPRTDLTYAQDLHTVTRAPIHFFYILLPPNATRPPRWSRFHHMPPPASLAALSIDFDLVSATMTRLGHNTLNLLSLEVVGATSTKVHQLLRERRVDQVQLQFRELHKDRMAKLDLFLSMEQLGYRMFHAEKSYGCKFCIDVAYIFETHVAG